MTVSVLDNLGKKDAIIDYTTSIDINPTMQLATLIEVNIILGI